MVEWMRDMDIPINDESDRLATANKIIAEQSALIAEMHAALYPLAAAADEFQWVLEKGLDPEGIFVWAMSSNFNKVPKISAGDAFRARAAIARAEGVKP